MLDISKCRKSIYIRVKTMSTERSTERLHVSSAAQTIWIRVRRKHPPKALHKNLSAHSTLPKNSGSPAQTWWHPSEYEHLKRVVITLPKGSLDPHSQGFDPHSQGFGPNQHVAV